MGYLGNDLQVAYSTYKNIDDISGSFNGSTTSFSLLVGGVAPVPLPLNSQQCLISVGGVIQRPDDTGAEGFRLSSGNIVFSSAPSTGEDFFGVILAGADYVNVGANFPSGSAAVPSITFDSDLDTGIYNSAANQVSITTAGTERLRIDSAGQIESVSLGSASAPSFSFTTDPNTGIYSPGADQVAVATNGTGRLFVDSSGRVLVGTSTSTGFIPPGESFTTAATVQVSGSSASGASSLQITDTVTGDYALGGSVFLNKRPSNDTGIGNGHTFGSVLFAGWDTAALRVGASIRAASDGQVWASGDCPSRLVFSTCGDGASSPTERMRITSAGLVGIGSTAPSQRLTVGAGSETGAHFARIHGANSDIYIGQSGGTVFGASTGSINFIGSDAAVPFGVGTTANQALVFGTNNSERARLDTSGRLLVGTSTAPSVGNGQYAKVVIQGSGHASGSAGSFSLQRDEAASSITSGEGIAYLNFNDNAGNTFGTISCEADANAGASDYPGRLTFSTTADGASSPTERMRISSLGVTTFKGNGVLLGISSENSNTYKVNLQDAGTIRSYIGATASNIFDLADASVTQRLLVTSAGAAYNSTGTWGSISDQTLKTDIQDAPSQWNDVQAIRFRKYRFIADAEENPSSPLMLGVVAQEIEETSPGLVETNENGIKSVKQSVLLIKAAKALQEAMERIETLEAKVAALEAQ
jgi:hypothetical protein